MPVDLSKSNPRDSHRSMPDGDSQEDLERRRARGEVSCAECRRLKLRCDKKLPCSSCVRRGCSLICPNGSLKAGQGTRFVLANTEQLHRKVGEMSERIRQLEDALEILQSAYCNGIHPLLRPELMVIKHTLEARHPPEEPIPDLVDAFGTLAINGDGSSQFFARSAGSETLLLRGNRDTESEWPSALPHPVTLPPEVTQYSEAFPFRTDFLVPVKQTVATLERFLPPWQRAWGLCESYLENGGWHFRPIRRDDLINQVLPVIYNSAQTRAGLLSPDPDYGTGTSPESDTDPHELALLFLVFSFGALVDMTLPSNNAEADHYFHLGRAALSLRFMFDSPTMSTVQAVALMAIYHGMSEKSRTLGTSHTLLSIASHIAQSLGLHRDSARWGLDSACVDSRRNLFWELMSADHLQSLVTARPAVFSLPTVDCETPIDYEQTLNEKSEVEPGYWAWKYKMVKDVLTSVVQSTTTAASPSHATIMALDRKIREWDTPLTLQYSFEEQHDEVGRQARRIERFQCAYGQAVMLIYIHRSFFAQSILDHPTNPSNSPYAASFLATYRSASYILKIVRIEAERPNNPLIRFPSLWTHTFSAAVIVGSVVTRGPNASFASSALIELAQAVTLFEKGAVHLRRARMALPILVNLLRKAHQAYTQYYSGEQVSLLKDDACADEVAIFGGHTRLFDHTFETGYPSPPPDLSAVNAAVESVSSLSSLSNSVSPPSISEIQDAQETVSSVDYQSTRWASEPLPTDTEVEGAETAQPEMPYPGITSTVPDAEAWAAFMDSYQALPSIPIDTSPLSPENMQIFGLNPVSAESGMEETWTTFIRESGLFDSGAMEGYRV